MADRYDLTNYSGEQVKTAIGRGLTSLQPTAQTLSDIQKQTVRTNIGAMGALNIYNPNLLINGDFAINQRGLSSYTGANNYTVDRWQNGASFVTATVLSKGVRLTASTSGTTGANYFLYNQTIEDYSKYAGKTVTATLAYENNTFVNGRINIRCDTTSNYSTAIMSTSGIITFTFTLPSSITSSLKLIITGNHTNGTAETVDLLYAKLELGSVATPFVPPLVAEELPKCQRYGIPIRLHGGANYATSPTALLCGIPLPATLRTTPTILVSTQPTVGGNGSIYTVTNTTVNSTYSNEVILAITTSGLTENEIYALQGGVAFLDAEIY